MKALSSLSCPEAKPFLRKMDSGRYEVVSTGSPDTEVEDDTSTLIETKYTPRQGKLQRLTLLCVAILVLTFLTGILLVYWRFVPGPAPTNQEPVILDYFRQFPDVRLTMRHTMLIATLVRSESGLRQPGVTERIYWDYDDDFLNPNLTIAHEAWASLLPCKFETSSNDNGA